MRVPSFQSLPKTITQVSPMEYVKATRPHQARLLMVRLGLSADAASHAVGCTSPSQFSREFKRLFRLTTTAETRRMRETFAVPAFADATMSRHTEPRIATVRVSTLSSVPPGLACGARAYRHSSLIEPSLCNHRPSCR